MVIGDIEGSSWTLQNGKWTICNSKVCDELMYMYMHMIMISCVIAGFG